MKIIQSEDRSSRIRSWLLAGCLGYLRYSGEYLSSSSFSQLVSTNSRKMGGRWKSARINADQVEKSQNEFPNLSRLMGLINYPLVC